MCYDVYNIYADLMNDTSCKCYSDILCIFICFKCEFTLYFILFPHLLGCFFYVWCYFLVIISTGHVNGVNVIGVSLQGPSVPGLAVMRPPTPQQGDDYYYYLFFFFYYKFLP